MSAERAAPGAQIGHDNREAVRAYFLSHVGATNTEVATALGLSVMAVGRHVKTLRGEWLTPQKPTLKEIEEIAGSWRATSYDKETCEKPARCRWPDCKCVGNAAGDS